MLDSMIRRGFTVVELIITITIMGILLTLAVVNLTASQANGRDAERKNDVESLALHLESFYTNQSSDSYMSGGTYLGTDDINTDFIASHLPDIDPKTSHAPGADVNGPISIVPATNTITTTTGVLPQPSKSNDVYVYQPLTTTGALCDDRYVVGECRKFNIYYFQEVSGTVEMIKSKHQ